MLCYGVPGWAQPVNTGPRVSPAVYFDASPHLRDLRPLPRPFRSEPEPRLLLPRTKAQLARQSMQVQPPDPVVQSTTGPLVNAPATLANFDAIGNGVAGFVVNAAPPDTNMTVGPNHLVQVVNTDIAVYKKSGALLD